MHQLQIKTVGKNLPQFYSVRNSILFLQLVLVFQETYSSLTWLCANVTKRELRRTQVAAMAKKHLIKLISVFG